MNEINEIWKQLEQIKQQGRSVGLVKHLVDKTIRLNVTISHISRSQCEIVVASPKNRDIFYLADANILIQNDSFPYPIRATVSSVDIYRHLIVLTDLLYPVSMRESRKEFRIQPKEALNVRIAYQADNECQASIFDLSEEGVSLVINVGNMDLADILVPDDSVRLHLCLQTSVDAENEISFPATISYIKPLETPQDFRIGFMTFPSEQEKTALRRYIVDCQNVAAMEITPFAI